MVPTGNRLNTATDNNEELHRQLRDVTNELQDFVENATIGLHRVGPDGVILWANKAELDMLGYTAEEYIGRHIAEFHADAHAIEDILTRLRGNEQLHDYEARVRCKDGSIKYGAISSNVYWKDGQFIHTRCFTRDITARKQAEKAHRESEAKLRAILDHTEACIFIKDLHGRYVLVNRSTKELFGWPDEDWPRGKTDFELFPKEMAASLVANDQGVLQFGEPREFEEIIRHKDDSYIYLVQKFPLRDVGGTTYAICGIATDITERKQAEQAKAELAAIVDNSDDAIIGKTLDGIITSWNGGAERIYGYTAQEMLGQPIARLVPAERSNELPDILARIKQGELIGQYHTRRQCKDGRIIDVSLTVSPVCDSEGRIIGASAVARDISEWMQTQEALRESEERLRFTLQAARVGSWVWNIQTGQVKWSDNLEAIHDRPPGTFGEAFDDVLEEVYPPDRSKLQQAITNALKGDGSFQIEYRFLKSDGSIGWLHGQGQATFDASGKPVHMAGICMDVTARRRAEEKTRVLAEAGAILANSLDTKATLEAVARLLVPSLGDWCAIDLVHEGDFQQDGVVVHSDPKKVELARDLRRRWPPGMDDQYGVGCVIRTGEPELFQEISDDLLCDSARDDEHLSILRNLGLKSGLVVPLVARARTLGAMTLVIAESQRRYNQHDLDVIEELAGRCALAIDNAQLYEAAQIEIAERKRTEEKLRQARDAAEAANRAKSEFLTKMSHELRTPLNAIIGMSKMLSTQRFGSLNDKQLDYLLDITQAGEHLLNLINDILDLSKVEAGRIKLRPEPVPVASTIDQVVSTIRPLADNKQLDLRAELPQPDGTINTDLNRFKQVLYNLISNAVKFTPEGGKVRIRCHWVAAARREAPVTTLTKAKALRIDMEDTGIGISAEDQKKLGTEFFQANSSPGKAQEGAGLGLALSRKLIHIMNGHFWFTSEVGKGSTFSFALPLRPECEVPAASLLVETEPVVETAPIQHTNGEPLGLIIDDHAPTNTLLADWLEEAGVNAVSAYDGLSGLEEAKRLKPHLILLDMRLPDMNGFEVLNRLKTDPATAGIPVVVVTVMESSDHIQKLDIADWFVKPLDKELLLQRVRQLL